MNQRESFEKWQVDTGRTDPMYLVFSEKDHRYGLNNLQDEWEIWQAAQQPQWQPIETAPRDGTSVITYRNGKHGTHIEAMYFADGAWYWSFDGDSPDQQPTHWMPLPPEPKK